MIFRLPESECFDNLSDREFDHWTVKWFYGQQKGQAMFLCECVCGVERPVRASSLRSGRSTSCGCMKDTTRKDYRKSDESN